MAPKRSAPPPPVESTEELDSGSDSDESEEESAPSATPKQAPPPQKVQQPESSDEEEEEEEEEEEDEAEEEEAEKEEEEEDGEEEESESDEEEEESGDEVPVPAQQEIEGKGGMPPPPSKSTGPSASMPSSASLRNSPLAAGSSLDNLKPADQIQRAFSKDDEVLMLEVLAAHRLEKGRLPQTEELEAVFAGRLGPVDRTRKELTAKLKTLKSSYTRAFRRGVVIRNRDSRFFDLCNEVWGIGNRPADGTGPRDFNDICQMYPFIAEEMNKLDKENPGLFKRQYSVVTGDKARAMEERIKKQRISQIKLVLRRSVLIKKVTNDLLALVK